MARVMKILTWTAIFALPGGALLLPVVVARRLAKGRPRRPSAPPDSNAS